MSAVSDPLSSGNCPACGARLTDDGACARCLLGGLIEELDHPLRTPPRPLRADAPRPLGDYELLEEIAHGGMGIVWKARDRRTQRTVALKFIRGGNLPGEASAKRFRREAELTADIRHPNIVAIHEIGEQDEQLFLAMDIVRGGSLADRIDRGSIPPREAAALMAKVARAIHFAHTHGILHRDLKPANILIGPDGEPQVCDFGLARAIEEESHLTLSGELLGTPAYLSPEVIAGARNVTTASDVYSLGAILYEILAGGPAFASGTLPALLRKITDEEPVRPMAHADGTPVPHHLATIALTCMEKQPEARYASALELAEDLERWLAGEPIHAQSAGTIVRAIRWARRKPVIASLWGLVALLIVVVAIGASVLSLRLAREKAAVIGQERRARGQIARQHSESAQRFMAEADALRALPSLVEAIRIGTGDPRLDEANRIRFAVILRTSPTLRNVWLEGVPFARAASTRTGDRLMLASPSGIEIWDPNTVQRLNHLPKEASVTVFDPSVGKWVAFENSDGKCFVWRPESGKIHKIGDYHLSPHGDTYVHSDGSFAVRNGRNVEVRSATDGALLAGPFEHPANVRWAFSLSGDRKKDRTADKEIRPERLLVADENETLHCWDVETRSAAFPPLELRKGPEAITLDSFDAASWQVILHRERECWIVDLRTGKIRLHHEGKDFPDLPQNFAWVGGKAVYLSRSDSGSMLRDVESNTFHWESQLPGRGFRGSFAPQVGKVATQSWNGAARIMESRSQGFSTLLWQPATPAGCLLDPAGRWFFTRGDEPSARLWALRDGDGAVRLPAATTPIVGLWYAGAPERLYTAAKDGQVSVWDVSSPARQSMSFSHPREISWAGPVSRGRTFTADEKSVHFWDSAGTRTGRSYESEGPIIYVASHYDAGRVAIVLKGGGMVIWDPVRGAVVSRFEADARNAELAADGRRLLAVSFGSARVWDAQTGQPISPAVLEPRENVRADLSPDGARVLQWSNFSAPGQHSARVWDAATGRIIATLAPHWRRVRSAAWSPDGTRILTGGDDNAARLCDAATGRAMVPAVIQFHQISDLGFSPDGLLMWTRADRSVVVWDASSGEAITPPLYANPTHCFIEMRSRYTITIDCDKELPAIHDLTPDMRPVEQLSYVARALSSHTLALGTTLLEPVSFQESRAAWEQFKKTSAPHE